MLGARVSAETTGCCDCVAIFAVDVVAAEFKFCFEPFLLAVGFLAATAPLFATSFFAVSVGPFATVTVVVVLLAVPLLAVLRGRPGPFFAATGGVDSAYNFPPGPAAARSAAGLTVTPPLLKAAFAGAMSSSSLVSRCVVTMGTKFRGFFRLRVGAVVGSGSIGTTVIEFRSVGAGTNGCGGEGGKAVIAAGTPGIFNVPPGPSVGTVGLTDVMSSSSPLLGPSLEGADN